MWLTHLWEKKKELRSGEVPWCPLPSQNAKYSAHVKPYCHCRKHGRVASQNAITTRHVKMSLEVSMPSLRRAQLDISSSAQHSLHTKNLIWWDFVFFTSLWFKIMLPVTESHYTSVPTPSYPGRPGNLPVPQRVCSSLLLLSSSLLPILILHNFALLLLSIFRFSSASPPSSSLP